MSFPDLAVRNHGALLAEATGVPSNGNNTFALGLSPLDVDEDWLNILTVAITDSVTDVTYISLSADKTHLTLNFAQSGTGSCRVTAWVTHSTVR